MSRELRKKIERHFTAMIAAAHFRLSNARSEATNNKIKLTIRTVFGFHNVNNLTDMVMLSRYALRSPLPGRLPTHSYWRCTLFLQYC